MHQDSRHMGCAHQFYKHFSNRGGLYAPNFNNATSAPLQSPTIAQPPESMCQLPRRGAGRGARNRESCQRVPRFAHLAVKTGRVSWAPCRACLTVIDSLYRPLRSPTSLPSNCDSSASHPSMSLCSIATRLAMTLSTSRAEREEHRGSLR
jgi:hypothetical protein